MKKSVILLELIISITILSIIAIYSLRFISELYQSNTQNLTLLNNQLDFKNTQLFIENKLNNSVNIAVSKESLSFYEVDINSFKSNYYSGFALLEKSSKEYVFTPNSIISKIDLFFIWFDNTHMYEIEQQNENDKIYFKNKNNEKTIFEHYKLIKGKSSLYLRDKTLYFNKNILLENIETFEVLFINKHIKINICQKFCEEWVIQQ